MKILFILRAMAQKAGSERVMSDKINWLAQKGHHIIVVTYEQGNHPLSFNLHPTVNVVDLDTRFFKLGHYNYFRRMFEYSRMRKVFFNRLQNVIDKYKPDLIVSTTYSMNVASIITKLNGDQKTIIESHAAKFSVGKEFDYRNNFLLKLFFHFFDKVYFRTIRKYDLLIALTKGDSKDWSNYNDNVKTIPNPLTFLPSQLPDRALSNRIICVGRLTYQKGFDLLINACVKIFQHFPQWHVDIYGDGEDKDMLQNMINCYGMTDFMHLCGPTNNIYENYLGSDFFILSSRFEGFGLVLIEAMSCGCPCVSFRCKYGPEDIIEDGVSGLLVKNGDIDELADKMVWMMSHDKERIEMGNKAREVASNYQLDAIMQKWEEAYLSVL